MLTSPQRATVDYYKSFNVPATWFEGEPDVELGRVEVIALGPNYVWSLRIDPDGTADTSEATLGEFNTGIEV